ncbi:MAG: hypothetical protein HC836_36235 [Richelia sp. RM2_1_2]|nr:hypothetical protein [Richelia sp. SM2_1_7]NJM20657.1 hypothetical protein [Richelia sp. SM1_7_0]NJN12814.1 hypothetical protein [Richelia sp. RM1_1_1]NJO27286.1 hypothetical protein [Richelia sp. SL_2_1]NJO63453.1 hypothetical protein [Richelia sp. RM2_1_2]
MIRCIPGIDMARIERESMNFKLPKPLAEALRKAASPQPGFTATDIVIRGLLHELGDIPGVEPSAENQLHSLESELQQLQSSIQERDNSPTDFRKPRKVRSTQQSGSKARRSIRCYST